MAKANPNLRKRQEITLAFPRPKASPLPEPDGPAPLPASLPELEEVLAGLNQQREALRQQLADTPAREARLIAENAPDAEFEALDHAGRTLKRQIAKLDLREQELLARGEQLRAVERRRKWDELVERYTEAAKRLVDSMQNTQQRHAEATAIVNEAEGAGFFFGNSSALPRPPRIIESDPSWFQMSVDALTGRGLPPAIEAPPLIPVRFTRGWGQFNAAETAGFVEAEARKLVDDLRVAEWVMQPRLVAAQHRLVA